jgi:multicomponent Na+:H+ antiporter subunit E
MLLVLSLTVSLFLFWLALSGIYTPFLVGAGALSAFAVALLARRMEIADREGHPVHMGPRAPAYWLWLLKEMLVSGLRVTRIILHPSLPISPALARFEPAQESAVGLATHANSITLTPGTVTLEATHRHFVVHGLTREGAHDSIDSEMNRRVRRLESGR